MKPLNIERRLIEIDLRLARMYNDNSTQTELLHRLADIIERLLKEVEEK